MSILDNNVYLTMRSAFLLLSQLPLGEASQKLVLNSVHDNTLQIASRPSVKAAGPGWRIKGDLIS